MFHQIHEKTSKVLDSNRW